MSGKDIYEAVSKELLAYGNKQDDLLDLMDRYAKQKKVDTESIETLINDGRKEKNKNQKIDPFTFLAYLSKGSNMTPKFLEFLKNDGGLTEPLPGKYDGFLYVYIPKWRFFNEDERKNIPELGKLFNTVVTTNSLPNNITTLISGTTGVKGAVLSKALYGINPDKFICINDKIKNYLKVEGINVTKVNSLNDYNNIITSINRDVKLKAKGHIRITYEAL